jgi:hypothetical protein
MRSTMFSPCVVGCEDTRKSTWCPESVSEMRPSCGRARLGDVHPAHHLQAHHHRRPVVLVQRPDLAQHAVDPVADAQEPLLRLEVDVGGVALGRVVQQRIHQAHHRLAVFVEIGGERLVVDLAGLDLVQDPVDGELEAVVVLDADGDVGFAREHLLDAQVLAGERPDLVERHHVGGVRHRDQQLLPLRVVAHREHVVAARHVLRDERDRRRVDDGVLQVDGHLAQRLRQDVADRGLGDEPERHQDLAERRLEALLLGERDVQLVLADDSLAEQRLPERDLREGCGLHGAHQGLASSRRATARGSNCAPPTCAAASARR